MRHVDYRTDYRDVFASKQDPDHSRPHKSHRTRALIGREEKNFAAGYAAYLLGQHGGQFPEEIAGGGVDTARYITAGDAGRRLGLSRQRIHVLIRQGRLEAVQVGEGVRRTWLVNGEKLGERIVGRRPKEEQR